jgi:hypothetical protein
LGYSAATDELQAVETLVGRVNEGGGALLIRGDAGIGKSALLGHAIEVGEARACGSCEPSASAPRRTCRSPASTSSFARS